MEEKIVVELNEYTGNSFEKENELLRMNLESLKQRNSDLEKVNEGLLELAKELRQEKENLSKETQRAAGSIVGMHNKNRNKDK